MAVKNRIAGTAHTTNLVEHGIVSDKLIEYHAACAARGVGLTIRAGIFRSSQGDPSGSAHNLLTACRAQW
jgi:2,4-dienoyl-CoA reductase-like NADH-dependent reductase (Old Yellow Enzyme family)